ncbi:MAG: MATE family efflux transporter [Lachnospiraceae bacterium]|nr:MATE family efflux transporter [Lachnospiraceae bacterium]
MSEEKNKRREEILTKPLLPLLIKIAVPTIIGMLITMIYNLTDTFFIGLLSKAHLTAAIGVVYSFVSMIQALGFWFGYGSGNRMSRCLGRRDEKEAELISADGLLLSVVSGIVLLIVLYPFSDSIAGFLGANASERLHESAVVYLRIMLVAMPFSIYALTLYNQLRLCGNVKDGMLGLMSGIILNIILDPIFILGLDMEIKGAGYATLIGQVTGSMVLTFLSFRHGNIKASLFPVSFKEGRLFHILAGGAPNFSRQSITSIAGVLLNMAASKYGENTIAAMTVATRVIMIAYSVMIGIGQGFQPICAMNYGAGKYDRVRRSFRLTVCAGTIVLVIATPLVFIFADSLSSMLSGNAEVAGLSAYILRIQVLSLPLMAFFAVSSMYMQNMGKYGKALFISVCRQGIFFMPLVFILPPLFDETGLYLIQPVADVMSFLAAVLIVRKYGCKEKEGQR